jgi:hypothetical protein
MAEKQLLGFKRALNRSAANIPSMCRIANIALNDVVILPYDANPSRMEFSERTTVGPPPANCPDATLDVIHFETYK